MQLIRTKMNYDFGASQTIYLFMKWQSVAVIRKLSLSRCAPNTTECLRNKKKAQQQYMYERNLVYHLFSFKLGSVPLRVAFIISTNNFREIIENLGWGEQNFVKAQAPTKTLNYFSRSKNEVRTLSDSLNIYVDLFELIDFLSMFFFSFFETYVFCNAIWYKIAKKVKTERFISSLWCFFLLLVRFPSEVHEKSCWMTLLRGTRVLNDSVNGFCFRSIPSIRFSNTEAEHCLFILFCCFVELAQFKWVKWRLFSFEQHVKNRTNNSWDLKIARANKIFLVFPSSIRIVCELKRIFSLHLRFTNFPLLEAFVNVSSYESILNYNVGRNADWKTIQ